MKKTAFVGVMLVISVSLVWAQLQVPKPAENLPNAFTPLVQRGLFDPSRFSMSNSFSMTFLSNGKQSTVQNLYVNSSRYQLTNHLSLNLDLGYRFNPLSASSSKEGAFLPNAEVRYTPNDHLLIQMSYRTLDPYAYGFQRWPQER